MEFLAWLGCESNDRAIHKHRARLDRHTGELISPLATQALEIKVEIIASAVSYISGYNIHLLPIIQSRAQLDVTYGQRVAQQKAAAP